VSAGWVVAIVIVIAAAAVSPPVSNRLGYEPPFDLAAYFEGSSDLSSRRFEVFPGGPGITVEGPLYAPRDPWKRWLADESTCPGGERTDGSPQVQTLGAHPSPRRQSENGLYKGRERRDSNPRPPA
jgi:hypothetical protein